MKRFIVVIALLASVAALLALAAGCGEKDDAAGTEPSPGTQPASSAPSGKATVKVYFLKGETPFEVSRETPVSGAGQALRELLGGPSEEEKQQGLSTAIPAGTMLINYNAAGGVATVDFSGELRNYGGGSAAVQAITGQIESTVRSNDASVTKVEITIEGVPSDEALQP